ncbi:hypothetical protein EDD18DRAFT_1330529 [Armillaria luteobubalina]|uniref:Uncharacterized protein n=1 Tax=Armillaria luteobubalina TaxID=153913 RepID=A0AA39QAE7_9AGAR|nr:hypothetical protein EDD18DRAFT_1330529 [Armillaria luteobubalina]
MSTCHFLDYAQRLHNVNYIKSSTLAPLVVFYRPRVFQEYYEETLLKNYNPSTIAWIGSVQYAGTDIMEQYTLIVMPGIIAGQPFNTSGSLHTRVYPGIIGYWFRRRREITMRLMAAAAPIGGTAFPVVAHELMKNVGHRPLDNETPTPYPAANESRATLYLKAFTNVPYIHWRLPPFTAYLGMYQHFLISLIPYYVSLADALNILGLMTIIAGAVTYAWPFARTLTSMIVAAVIYGQSTATLVAVAGPPISDYNTTGGFEAMGYDADLKTG